MEILTNKSRLRSQFGRESLFLGVISTPTADQQESKPWFSRVLQFVEKKKEQNNVAKYLVGFTVRDLRDGVHMMKNLPKGGHSADKAN